MSRSLASLGERKVAGAVDRESEDAVVAGKNAGGPVALMDVAIDDQHPLGATFGLHGASGDGGIVEDAESLAAIAEGMVGAAGQVGRHGAAAQGRTTGRDRCAGGAPRAFDHARAPWKADGLLGLFRQLTATNLPDVFGIVGARQLLVAGGMRQVKVALGELTGGEQFGA